MLADTSSAERLFELLNTFEILSGLKINCLTFLIPKTEGMRIGSKRHYKEKPFGIKWPYEPVKTLGVHFTYDQTCLKKRTLLNDWIQLKGLSIYGKVTIIKLFLSLSTFAFVRSFQLPRNC